MSTLPISPASTEDYRRIAEKRLPRSLFDYIDGGACDEITLARNVSDFQHIKMKQQVMRDVSTLKHSTTLLGREWTIPVALAPVGMGGMMARRAETQAKRASDAFGIPFCLSTVSICSLEEVAEVSEVPFWFQLYMLKDRGVVKELLQRAKAVGVTTLVFTVDLAVVGTRYRDVRNGTGASVGPIGRFRNGLGSYLMHPKWLWDVGIAGKPHTFGNLTEFVPKAASPIDFQEWIGKQFDPSVTWKDIEWLRTIWDGNLVIKGVLSPEDALSASRSGADAIIVSNHGGRQLDGVSSSITVLPHVVDMVGDKVDVLMDGGVRNGQDIVKAVALGAKAVLIGRPWVYSVVAQGEIGITNLLTSFQKDMNVSMALTGVKTLEDLSQHILEISDV